MIDVAAPRAEIQAEIRRSNANQKALISENALMLYAGANVPRSCAGLLHEPTLSAMPAMGLPNQKEQPASKAVAQLETALSQMACHVFRARWADARLPSCTIANLVVYHVFGEHGVMLAPSGETGGHFSQRAGGTPAIVGLDVHDLPFCAETQTLDARKAAAAVTALRPKLIMLGRSLILRPDDLEPVVAAAQQVGARTIYDASHVAGLIAGNVFPNPLDAGIDLMTMSTYKTFGGPPGAIICGSSIADAESIRRAIDEAFLANQDAARFPLLLDQMIEYRDGSLEPAAILLNASAFKNQLRENGHEILLPNEAAATHQVIMPMGGIDHTRRLMRDFETAGILVGYCPVPGRAGQFGFRFGLQYLTRLGFGASESSDAAHLVSDTISILARGQRGSGDGDLDVAEMAKRVKALIASVSDRRLSKKDKEVCR